MDTSLFIDTSIEEQQEVYILPKNAFDKLNNTVRMFIQYANINEWIVLTLPMYPDPSSYTLVDKCIALDENGNLVNSPFQQKVCPITQSQLDEIIYYMMKENNYIDETISLNYLVWQAYTNYINSPQCTRRREEKIKRKEESEFWCY